MTSYFPDIDVWLALTYERHVHHTTAAVWLVTLSSEATLTFCRLAG